MSWIITKYLTTALVVVIISEVAKRNDKLGGLIGGDKVSAVRACSADAVATPNPGCMMQIGAGLRLESSNEGVIHPVELLDESYERAGFYRVGGSG